MLRKGSTPVLKQVISQLKFKSGPNLNISDSMLPTKSVLASYSREVLCLEHTKLAKMKLLPGLPSQKEQIIMLMFVCSSLLDVTSLAEAANPREAMFDQLKEKFGDNLLEDDTANNIEEILLELFHDRVLIEEDSLEQLRLDF
mmetsp:Transcript_31740/g.48660  ORF Transcript_31740/g.48660 Transcript_31740/m.48660 type:complete len:143 (-) Transcript_31740:1760-2188(-)